MDQPRRAWTDDMAPSTMRSCIIVRAPGGRLPPICGRLNHIEYLSHSRSRQTCSATERAKAGPIRGVGADVLRHDRQVAGLGAIAQGLVGSSFRSATPRLAIGFRTQPAIKLSKISGARSAIVEIGFLVKHILLREF